MRVSERELHSGSRHLYKRVSREYIFPVTDVSHIGDRCTNAVETALKNVVGSAITYSTSVYTQAEGS